MKVGILGTGDVGQVLGRGFAGRGHEVKMGTRDPKSEKVQGWVSRTGHGASAGTFAEAAAFCELAVLATAWTALEEVVRLAGPDNLGGKVVIDAINPLSFGPAGPALAIGHTDSAGEVVQRLLPRARVVKAFNIVGNQHMIDPQFPGGPPDMFIAGNDAEAKRVVTEVLTSFGWNTIDMGGIEASRLLEPLAMIWISHYFRTRTGNHAFKLLRK